MKNNPVYTELKPAHLDNIISLIRVIRGETRPMEGHTDPGAITDCWNSLEEIAVLMANKLRPSFQAKTFSQKIGQTVTHILDRDHSGKKGFMHKYETEEKQLTSFFNTGQMVLEDGTLIQIGI